MNKQIDRKAVIKKINETRNIFKHSTDMIEVKRILDDFCEVLKREIKTI